jgi:bifunctional UDP-N-acetylglucosamine pyrophosphorylase/glucosamine-1-phosphate N-acetyltransferase
VTKPRAAVVLAAGEGTRMKSDRAKVLHEVGERPMVEHVVRSIVEAGIDIVVVVVGHQAADVKAAVRDFKEVTCVEQKDRKGTGHAVQQALPFLQGTWSETIVVVSGDTPLLTPQSIRALADGHDASGCAATVLTAELEDPGGYGRIVRDTHGRIESIVEEKDASGSVRALHEVNTGIYAFEAQALARVLQKVGNANSQGEYYLTDTIGILRQEGEKVAAIRATDPDEVLGVNTPEQLREVERIYREREAARQGQDGVWG